MILTGGSGERDSVLGRRGATETVTGAGAALSARAAPTSEGSADRAGTGPAPDRTDSGTEGETRALPLDTVFDLLSNHRRRLVLRYLESEGEAALGDLAEVIAGHENDKPRAEVTATERKRTYVALYQCHVPKLEEADVVETDRSREVRAGPNAPQLLSVLESAETPEPEPKPSAPVFYLAGALVGSAGGALWGLGPASIALLGAGLLVAALAAMTLVACVQWLRTAPGTPRTRSATSSNT
jgi:hypothetical protein